MIPYKPFSDHLKKLGVLATPSELHAFASGMLCVNKDVDVNYWIECVGEDYCISNPDDPNLRNVLLALFDYAKEHLQREDFAFELVLPDDSEDMSERLSSLSVWVATFMSALVLGGLSDVEVLSDEVNEFMQDMDKITRIDREAEDNVGEELDFYEIVEYVRSGSMMIFLELNKPQPKQN
ncbi:MAG: UPF0149 family protein [Proteobacteria bacterium]|nr:UPF0149 family protein [Pseudomonadota bacterium]